MNLGKNMSHWTEDRIEQAKALWVEGLSATQIARVLDPSGNVSRNSVLGKLLRLGMLGGGTGEGQTPSRSTANKPRSEKRASLPSRPTTPMPDPLRVPILDLQFGHCRFPLWSHQETGAPDFPHCGLPKSVGSYCEHHAVTAFGPANVRAFQRGTQEASRLAEVARNARALGAV